MKRRHVVLAAAACAVVLGLLATSVGRGPSRASSPRTVVEIDPVPAETANDAEVPDDAAQHETAVAVVGLPPIPVPAELSPADRETIERHMRRFGPQGPEGPPHGSDAVLGSVPRSLAKEESESARNRRLEQLEALRTSELLDLLDAIAAGLAWLAAHQGPNGEFVHGTAAHRCVELGHTPPCVTPTEPLADWPMGATALAVMAFAGFRDLDVNGRFEPAFARGVASLRSKQAADGRFPATGASSTLALIALGRAAAATGDAGLRDAVQRGLARLAKGADPDGGYRYRHEQCGDLRETAWVARAAEEARNAGIEVPAEMTEGLPRFLTSVWSGGHRFTRLRGSAEWPALWPTGMATGLLIWDDARHAEVLDDWRGWVAGTPPTRLYPLYHGVQVAVALEPAMPPTWRDALLALAAKQEQSGAAAGAWRDIETYPLSEIGYAGVGVVHTTALAVLILEEALRVAGRPPQNQPPARR